MTQHAARTALVTGGSRGIGRAVVQRLCADGARVVFSYLQRADAADEVVAATGGRAVAVRADLRDRAATAGLYDRAEATLGGLDVLVCNAGSHVVPKPLSQTTDGEYDELMAVNTRSTFTLLRAAATRLRDGGRIVAVSTINTVLRNAVVGVHAASKAAVEQLAACLAHEVAPRGITVNTVSPGLTDTELLRGNNPGVDLAAAAAAATPLGRLGTPQDIAAVVAFLVGPDGGWVTGQNLRAGGGLG